MRQRRPRSLGEQPETGIEPVQDLLQREHAQPHGRELDGERDTVEAAADPRDQLAIAFLDGEARQYGGGPVGEQRRRLPVPWFLAAVRQRQRRDHQYLLAVRSQDLPAGHQDPQLRRRGQQAARERGAGGHQVFAVVEDQQQPLVVEVVDESRQPVTQAENGGDGARQHRRIGDARQPHQPHSVGESAPQARTHAQRQPRFADPAHSGERDQPGIGEQPLGLGQLTATADETRQLGRQVPRLA